MKIREAILKAADHIEANPETYRFFSGVCGEEYGCALVHIANQLGIGSGRKVWWNDGDPGFTDFITCEEIIDMPFKQFEGLFIQASGCETQHAIRFLRDFADKYHPEESFPEIEAELNRIFRETAAA